MSEAAPNFQKQKQTALTALLGVSLVLGILETALIPTFGEQVLGLQLCGSLVMLLIGFYWLHYDSHERGIRRPVWLNIGIVMAAIAFVPYYLYKTRPLGQRGRAIAAFFGLVLASAILSAVGVTAVTAMQNMGT